MLKEKEEKKRREMEEK